MKLIAGMLGDYMDMIVLKSAKDLADRMKSDIKHSGESAAVLYFKDAKELLAELIQDQEICPVSIYLGTVDAIGQDQFYVTLTNMHELFIEPVKNERGKREYLETDAAVCYIHSNMPSGIIPYINSSSMHEVYYEGEDDFGVSDLDDNGNIVVWTDLGGDGDD